MSFAEVLQELPGLTISQRQLLIRRALELDDAPLAEADVALVEERLAAHHKHPDTSLSLDQARKKLRSRSSK